MNRVLVTGMPRSGTTFVGQILAIPTRVAYLHEPMNPDCGLPAATTRFVDLGHDASGELADEMLELLELRGRLKGAVYPTDSTATRAAKLVLRGRGPGQLMLARLPPRPEHVVVKDPFALNSIRWFEAHDTTTVLLVRHPAALVSSFRRLGWTMTNHVRRFADRGILDADELAWLPKLNDDLDRLALFWRVMYRRATDELGQGLLVVHEQLSRDPETAIDHIRSVTGLPGSRRADRKLRTLTSGSVAAAKTGGRTQQFRRASADILDATLARLTEAERARVWEIAGDLAQRWYLPDGIR